MFAAKLQLLHNGNLLHEVTQQLTVQESAEVCGITWLPSSSLTAPLLAGSSLPDSAIR
jgi:hypothetical protein